MATSGSYNLSSGYGTIRIEWWYISQNIGANTTRIGWRAVATWASNTWLQVYACRVWINGAQVLNRGSAQTWGGQFASGELDIGMNNDGNKYFGSNGEAAIYTAGINATGSGGWDLPQVPRAAIITSFPSYNDSGTSNPRMTIDNPANGYIAAFIRKNDYIYTDDYIWLTRRLLGRVNGTINFTPTQAEWDALNQYGVNATNWATRLVVQTYSDSGYSNQLGANQGANNTYTVTNATPDFPDFTFRDSNATITAITGNDQYIVQGKSQLEVTISAANKMVAKKFATPTDYRFQISSIDTTQAYSASDIIKALGTVGANTITPLVVTARDSRGLSKSVTKSITVVPYQAPQVNPTAERVNNFETSTKIRVTGVISRLTIGGTDKNAVNAASGLQYRYKKTTDATWGSWANIATTTSSGNVSMTDFYVNLDRNFAWNVEFKLTDKIEATTVAIVVGVGIPIFRIGTDGKIYNNEIKMVTEDDLVAGKHMQWDYLGFIAASSIPVAPANDTASLKIDLRSYFAGKYAATTRLKYYDEIKFVLNLPIATGATYLRIGSTGAITDAVWRHQLTVPAAGGTVTATVGNYPNMIELINVWARSVLTFSNYNVDDTATVDTMNNFLMNDSALSGTPYVNAGEGRVNLGSFIQLNKWADGLLRIFVDNAISTGGNYGIRVFGVKYPTISK